MNAIDIQHMDDLFQRGRYDQLEKYLSIFKTQGLIFYTTSEQTEWCYYQLAFQMNRDEYVEEDIYELYKQLIVHTKDLRQKLLFSNIRIVRAIFNKQYSEALAVAFDVLQKIQGHEKTYPNIYATALGNALYVLTCEKHYKKAVNLYKRVYSIELEQQLLTNPKLYFHIHENLVDSYIHLGQHETAKMIIESMLLMPQLTNYVVYVHLFHMAYGYLLAQKNIDEGVAYCMQIADGIDFGKVANRIAYETAYDKLKAVLHMKNDVSLLQKYE